MRKVICECGNSKWVLKESLTYTCIPPIHADIYECTKCGKTYEKTTQSTLEEYYPEVDLYDNEKLELGTTGDYFGDCFGVTEGDTASLTDVGIDSCTQSELSKVTYEDK